MLVELRRFFDRAIRASFHDLCMPDEPAASYLADLLTRFARTEQLYPRGLAVPRLETVADMLLEVQASWQVDTPTFHPEQEIALRRHIGDYTLFMTGVFRERVERMSSARHYIAEGKRAYHFVSEHARASSRRPPEPYRRLAEAFEGYASALDYARRVHFRDAPGHPFFGLSFD